MSPQNSELEKNCRCYVLGANRGDGGLACGNFNVAELVHEVGGVFVVLGEEAESHGGHWVVAPAVIEGGEQAPALLQEEMVGR